jgi:pyridoxamine 5'-phosphate oxidase
LEKIRATKEAVDFSFFQGNGLNSGLLLRLNWSYLCAIIPLQQLIKRRITVDKKEILALITENPIGFLGTTEGKAARVRGMETYRADEKGLIFYTSKTKDVFQQIEKNPEVEVCYFAKGTQVRVRGKMEILEDLALKKEIVGKKPFLKQMYPDDKSYGAMGVCRLKGSATTWSMQNMAAPKTFIEL